LQLQNGYLPIKYCQIDQKIQQPMHGIKKC
jgi:hypothetical protein